MIEEDISFVKQLHKETNSEKASLLFFKNITYVNLEKSSTIKNTYLLWLRLAILVGPNKSRCNNSQGLLVETMFFDLKEDLVSFPNWQASHKWVYLKEILGKPRTRLYLESLDIYLKLKWPNIMCPSDCGLLQAIRQCSSKEES